MSPTTLVRAARRLSPKHRRASAGYLSEEERAQLRQMRLRSRKERDLAGKLRAKCTTPSARHLLEQALQTVELVDRYFLSTEFLQERKAPVQFSKWLDFVEQCLGSAVKKREFYETMLERYYPPDTPLPDCAGHTSKVRGQPRSRLSGSPAGNVSGAHVKVQAVRRSRSRCADEVADSRPPTADAMSISDRSRTASVRSAGGSSRSGPKPSCAKGSSNRVSRKTILIREAQRLPRGGTPSSQNAETLIAARTPK